jgi:RNA polymerase sigma-70 factor, ECF subfamily
MLSLGCTSCRLRAARFEVARRRQALAHVRGGDDDLAQQAADDALVAVLAKLPEFRGDSRFTTWAYKFALYEAAVKLRRRAWQDRELSLEPEAWSPVAATGESPDEHVTDSELLAALQSAIAEDLSIHQREVLVAVTLNDVPIDILAERLNTTRGALYKTLHDARKKLRRRLAADGFDIAVRGGDRTSICSSPPRTPTAPCPLCARTSPAAPPAATITPASTSSSRPRTCCPRHRHARESCR